MHRKACAVATALYMLIVSSVPVAPADALEEWSRFARSPEARALVDWAHCALAQGLAGTQCASPFPGNLPAFYGRNGVFVTLVRGKRVRGCYGAFHHASESLEEVLRDYLGGALRRDGRYPPLEVSELGETRVVITITGMEYPVDDISALDLARSGVVFSMESGAKLLFVPAEIKSIDYLKKRVIMKSVVQVAAFRAVSIR